MGKKNQPFDPHGMGKKPLDSLTAEVVKHLQDGTYVIQKVNRKIGVYDELLIEAVDAQSAWKRVTAAAPPLPPPPGATGIHGTTGPAVALKPLAASGPAVMSSQVASVSAVSGPPPGRTPSQLPDPAKGTEPIIGFRDFLVADSVTGFVLMSRNKTLWRQRERSMAYCNGNIYAPHDAPHWDCECGIYAFSTPTHRELKATDVAWAEIAMWGEVLVCDHGYRAQYAYPLSIFLRDTKTLGIKRVRDDLEAGYGVPVFLVEERDGKTAAEVMGELITEELLKREETIIKKQQKDITTEELRRMWDGPVD